MNTTATTARTTTDVRPLRSTQRRIRSRFLGLLLTAAAAVGLGISTAAPASAALAPDTTFHAECAASAVWAVAPNMRYYPNNATAWFPRLYIWTAYGWQLYRTGPSQAALGDSYNTNPWTISGSWLPTSWGFGSLPRGRYYQVKVTYVWIGTTISPVVRENVDVHHQVAQGDFTYSSYANSTSSYCYIP